MPEIVMPRLSDTMEDGVVSAWLKKVGDRITRGEIVAEIETDKALMELEAYDDGVLEKILAEAGARVPIGEPIAVVGDGTASSAVSDPHDTTAATRSGLEPTGVGKTSRTAAAPPASRSASDSGSHRTAGVRSSPLARKIARELQVEMDSVVGTGPSGRVTRRDVEAAHRGAEVVLPATGATSLDSHGAAVREVPPAGEFDEVALTTIQRVSAARLTASMQQAPHFYLTSAIDVTALFGFRAQINGVQDEAGESTVSVNDLLVKAVAVALRKDGSVNVSFAEDKLLRHSRIHIGVAVATPAGLLVPVIRDADRKPVSEIATEIRDMASRARDRKLHAADMTGGTFTISNLGMFGIEQFTAVINAPESAILAVGAAADELRLDNGEVVVRKILRVTMSADHRAIDGAVAAQFLVTLKDLLENPLRIVA
ncbi:dihydrolipoamide acetyltransferase family protein [Nocardia thailandica]